MRNGLLILLVLCGQWVFAQSPNYDLISTDDGLPSNSVYRVLIDAKGYLWFATPRGVAKYDGHNMKVFNTTNGLATNGIWNIWEDSQGRIWLYSFSNKAQFIENDSVITAFIKTAPNKSDNYLEEDGFVYAIDAKSIYQYKDGVVTKTDLGLSKDETYPATLLSKNFVLTYNRTDSIRTIVSISGNKERVSYNRSTTPAISRLQGKYMANADYVYSFVPNNRIVRWNWHTNQSIYFDLVGICKEGKKDGIMFFSGNNIQVSSQYGMVILDKDFNEIERIKNSNNQSKSSLVIKEKGIVFQVTLKKGVHYLTNQKKDCLHYQLDLAEGGVGYIGRGIVGDILIGCSDGSIYEFSDNELIKIFDRTWNPNAKGKEILITSILRELFFSKEINSYKEAFTELKEKNLFKASSANGQIKDLIESARKQFEQDGIDVNSLLALGPNLKLNWLSYTTLNSAYLRKEYKNGSTVKQIKRYRQIYTAITDDSTVWYGSPHGLNCLEGDSLRSMSREPNDIYSLEIMHMLVDKNQNLWVATNGSGIYCYQKGQQPIQVIGCKSDVIMRMKFSPNGSLWASTSQGIKEIKITKNPSLAAHVISTYTVHDGLPNGSSFHFFLTDSILYANTGTTISTIPTNKKREIIKPKLYLTGYSVNNQPRTLKNIASLPYEENNLSIAYSGVSLASKKALSYHYYIDHYTNDTLVTKENTIHLNNIASGDYKMTLFAQDDVGNRSKTKEISFSIAKPWYLQWWALLIYFSLFSIITYLFSAFRINKIRKQETTKKRMSELELQALQSQLNPHFIFNALGAIQYYQTDQDMELAEEYLGDFARLMRLYLESSKRAIVPLKDELELIQLYIDLEKLRFEDKFTVEVNIDQELEFEHINIPSMVLQPFVENAINHGLFHKKEPGHLYVQIKKQENQQIYVIVKDDGIGREAAQRIAKKSYKNYKSRAMQIIEERLSIMSKTSKNEIKIDIIDLFDDNGIANGTEVQIILPTS